MKELNVKHLSQTRKTALGLYCFIESTKTLSRLPILLHLLNPINDKMYTIIYQFLMKAVILNLFKTHHYSDKQTTIANFLKSEMREAYKTIKIFLTTAIDCGACRLPDSARNIIFSKEYISKYSYPHIREKLTFIKNNVILWEHNFRKNSLTTMKICIQDFLNCYEMLEAASSLDEKIVAVSKVLNVWHCNGPFFQKNYSENTDLNNPTAPFTEKQLESLSNITISQAENQIKKLL